MPQDSYSLIIAHPNPETLAQIRAAVEPTHAVLAECSSADGLRSAVLETRPDLLISGIEFADGNGLDVMIEMGNENPLPAVVVTTKRSLAIVEKAMQDHVMAYLIEPVLSDELMAAILLARGRFEQLIELNAEVDDLRQALDDRKIIERAKGVLMARRGLDEATAFAELRTMAQNNRIKLVESARRLLDEEAQTIGGG